MEFLPKPNIECGCWAGLCWAGLGWAGLAGLAKDVNHDGRVKKKLRWAASPLHLAGVFLA